jgi:hypothetical protein
LSNLDTENDHVLDAAVAEIRRDPHLMPGVAGGDMSHTALRWSHPNGGDLR